MNSPISASVRKTLPVIFRKASLDEHREIEAVQTRNGLVAKNYEEWKHLWINNPTYKRFPNWNPGWVAENEEGKIIGYAGHIPLSYQFMGREIVGACAHGMCIDPAYRGNGVRLLKRHLNEENTDIALTSSAAPGSARLCDVLCSRVPTGKWDAASFLITNYEGFSASVMGAKGWPGWLSFPLSVVLSARDQLTKTRVRKLQDRSRIRSCSSFDDRFDTFWDELKRTYPDRFLATRSREVLQWHFHYALQRNQVWIVTAEDDARLTAYAIFYRKDNAMIGLTRMRLIDFQVLQQDPQLLIPMLSWAFQKCEAEGIHVLEAIGFRPEKQQVINRLMPHRRRLSSWRYFYRSRDEALGQQLKNPAVWDPSELDTDSSL